MRMLSKTELGGGDDGLKPSPAFRITREFRTFTKILDQVNTPNPPILILPIKVGALFAKHMQHEAIKRDLNVLHIKEDDEEVMIVFRKDMYRVTLEYIYGRSDVKSTKQYELDQKEAELKEEVGELEKEEYEPGEGKRYLEEKVKDKANDIKDDAQPRNKDKRDIESDSEKELKDERNDVKEFNAQIPKENVFNKVPHKNRTLGVRYGRADDFFQTDNVTHSLFINLPIESVASIMFKPVNKGSNTINNRDDIYVVFEMVYTDTYGNIISQTIYLSSLYEFLASHEVTFLKGRVLIRPVRKASTSQASASKDTISEASTSEASTNQEAASESKIPSNEYKRKAAANKASTSEASTNQEEVSKASASKTSANQEATSVSKTPSKKYKSNIPSKKIKIRRLRRGKHKFTQTEAQDDASSKNASQDSNNTHDVPDIREKMGHIIELYGFPKEQFTTNNFLNIYKKEPRYVKWCDGNSVLLVTGSVEQANEFLRIKHKLVKSRPITLASALALKMAEKFPPAGNVKSMTWSRSQQISEQSSEEEE